MNGAPSRVQPQGSAEETVGMETLAHRFQDTIRDPLPTAGTHRQRILQHTGDNSKKNNATL